MEFIKAFEEIDKEETGEISGEDLEKYMREKNYKPAFVQKWLRIFDSQNTGIITLEEFCNTLGLVPGKKQKETIERRNTLKQQDMASDVEKVRLKHEEMEKQKLLDAEKQKEMDENKLGEENDGLDQSKNNDFEEEITLCNVEKLRGSEDNDMFSDKENEFDRINRIMEENEENRKNKENNRNDKNKENEKNRNFENNKGNENDKNGNFENNKGNENDKNNKGNKGKENENDSKSSDNNKDTEGLYNSDDNNKDGSDGMGKRSRSLNKNQSGSDSVDADDNVFKNEFEKDMNNKNRRNFIDGNGLATVNYALGKTSSISEDEVEIIAEDPDISEYLRTFALKLSLDAARNHDDPLSMAKYVKMVLDENFAKHWHVVTGRDSYGSLVTHEEGMFIHIKARHWGILMWQINSK